MSIFFPAVAQAATPPIPPSVLAVIGKISTEILNPIIALLFAVALIYFIVGVFKYIWNPDNEEMRGEGRRGMLWGIIGMFVMVSVFGIMKLIINSFGIDPSVMDYV